MAITSISPFLTGGPEERLALDLMRNGLVTGAVIGRNALAAVFADRKAHRLLVQRVKGEREAAERLQRLVAAHGSAQVVTEEVVGIVANPWDEIMRRFAWNHEQAIENVYGLHTGLPGIPDGDRLDLPDTFIYPAEFLPQGKKVRPERSEGFFCIIEADDLGRLARLFGAWEGDDPETKRPYDPWEVPVILLAGNPDMASPDMVNGVGEGLIANVFDGPSGRSCVTFTHAPLQFTTRDFQYSQYPVRTAPKFWSFLRGPESPPTREGER